MAIEGINSLGGIRQPDDQKVENESQVQDKPEAGKTRSSDKVDVVSGDVAQFKAQLDKVPDVRSDKIEALQKEIAEGTYKVPSEKLAELVLDELI
jgi:flagellar biosynthesis anti-sigma factor FlgM